MEGSETLHSLQIPEQSGGILGWEGCGAKAGTIAPEPAIHQGLQHPQMLTLTYFIKIREFFLVNSKYLPVSLGGALENQVSFEKQMKQIANS